MALNSRGPKKTWLGWQYFTTFIDNNETYSKCTVCDIYLNKGKNVSTLENHLKHHKEEYSQFLDKKKLEDEQKVKKLADQNNQKNLLDFYSAKSKPSGRKFDDHVDMLIASLLALPTISLNITTTPEFKNLFAYVAPTYQVKSRECYKQRMLKLLAEMKMKIQNELWECQRSKLNVIIDFWSSPGMAESYGGVVIQFCLHSLDDVKVVNYALAVKQLNGSHTADRISRWILHVLNDWKIGSADIFRFITDNASNCIAALKNGLPEDNEIEDEEEEETEENDMETDEEEELENENDVDVNNKFATILPQQFSRMSCIIHSLLCALRKVVDNSKSTLAAIKKRIFKLVKKLKHSSKAQGLLKELCGKKLIAPSATRWNICFLVFTRVLEIKDSIKTVCASMEWFDCLSKIDWVKLNLATEFLEPFHRFCLRIEGNNVTSPWVYTGLKDLIAFVSQVKNYR